MVPRDGGGPTLCMIRRHRRHRGAHCIAYVAITSVTPCQLRVFYGVPSRATLQDQPAVAICQALTTAHNRPETAALSKPGATNTRFRRMAASYTRDATRRRAVQDRSIARRANERQARAQQELQNDLINAPLSSESR